MEPAHPSHDIIGEENKYLAGRTIVVGVTGSVAAYRSVDLARWLMRRGARVKVVLTSEAAKLVTPQLFEWATGDEVYTGFSGETGHISLARKADAVVVAPATLSTMAKIAYGILDNPVALVAASALGYGKPVVVVPAMHENLYRTPQYKEVADRLESHGVTVVPPEVRGGVARYPEVHHAGRVVAALARRGASDLRGAKFLVTAGATREWIDPVRFISNPSSGGMGVEVALEAWARGAIVDLVVGAVRVPVPTFTGEVYRVESTEDMASTVRRLTGERRYDAVVAAAAPADFTPAERSDIKIRSGREVVLRLVPTPKVLEAIESRPRVLVAFAAETVGDLGDLEEAAKEKMEKYDADIVVGNKVFREGVGFASREVEAVIVTRHGVVFRGPIHKEELAARIVDEVSSLISALKSAEETG